MSTLTILTDPLDPIEPNRRMMQTFKVRCNGVEYLLFGAVICPPGDDGELNLEEFEFGGLIDVDEIVNILKKDPRTTDAYGERVQ